MDSLKPYYKWFCFWGVFFIGLSIYAYWRDENREWKKYQKDYIQREIEKASTPEEKQAAQSLRFEIKQIVIPSLNRLDRCMTCHITADDPTYAQVLQPLTYHSNHDQHPFDKFGCTVCHGGQGRALTKDAAHGKVPHWNAPLLPMGYIQSSCGKCHYPSDIPNAPDLLKGRLLFEEKGCIGCHKLQERGGHIGPDLSKVARAGHRDSDWLYQHFMEPQKVSPGSAMPQFNFTEEEAKDLTLYMLSLTDESIGGYFASKKAIPTSDLGRKLFEEKGCIGCHRVGNVGGTVGLALDNVGAKHSPEWLIRLFRDPPSVTPGTVMPNFGFTEDEARALTTFILDLDPQKIAGYLRVPTLLSPLERGKVVYRKYGCAGCHGKEGEKGIRNANAQTGEEVPSLTYVAEGYTKEELEKRILEGVPVVEKLNPEGTPPPLTMPAWQGKITPEELNDLIAYLLSLKPKEVEEEEKW